MTELPNTRVVLEGYIVVSNSDLPQVLQELPNHINLTKEEEGYLAFSVLQRPSEPNMFDVFEKQNRCDRCIEDSRCIGHW